VLGVLVLNETLSWHEPLGALLVLFGILLTQKRLRLPSAKEPSPAQEPVRMA
jgi:drug/metabolite transporter (DMT)-like permease